MTGLETGIRTGRAVSRAGQLHGTACRADRAGVVDRLGHRRDRVAACDGRADPRRHVDAPTTPGADADADADGQPDGDAESGLIIAAQANIRAHTHADSEPHADPVG